jgi:tripartite-type tricarboxylate transporter receptor subunit TctC
LRNFPSRLFRAAAAGAALSVTVALSSLVAQAQAWPQRTVRLVLPLGPGSGTDIGARIISDRLAKAWGQPVVVENRPGGDSVVAISSVINANDDHVLLWGPSAAFTAHPYTHAKIPYDIREIIPIVRVSNTLVVITVANSLKATTMAELAQRARAEPGKLNYASVTGLNDFLFQAFVKDAKLEMVRVPYRDAVQAATDVAENRIQAFSSAYAISRPQVESGKIRPIAFTNTKRAAIMPGIPTVREAGYPAMEFDGMVGVFGAKAVDAAARRRISADVREALKDAIVIDRLTATGQVVNPGDSAEFIAAIDEQRQVAAGAAKILGIKAAE